MAAFRLAAPSTGRSIGTTTNLRARHELIQAVMLWEGYHLYQFTIGERDYGEPGPDDAGRARKTYQAKSMRLGTLIDRGVSEFLYTYDFGDDWQHRVIVEHVGEAEPDTEHPRFIDGARRAPPEDVGGPPGFMEFVEAMAKSRHPQHKAMARWYGGPFNATEFGEAEIAASVREIAAKRKQALDAFARIRAMQNA